MKNKYDFVYLTNTPSFYKINLCNEISKKKKILIVFYGYGEEAVNCNLSELDNKLFDYHFLYSGNSRKRNKLLVFIKLLILMSSLEYKRVIFPGWMSTEYNLFSFLSPKSKNIVVCESSVLDSYFRGIKGIIKKKIISRMSYALTSGMPHRRLFDNIYFRGKVYITGSVGIFNKKEKSRHIKNEALKYLYVGRLVDVKDISLLIEAFNKNKKRLTIVGCGKLEKKLKSMANNNINFTGFIPNENMKEIYESHDIFILPSKYEPWGLVIEEAIYWGLPVIVSDKVGSHEDMVRELNTGVVFKSGCINSLSNAIVEIEKNYDIYKRSTDNVDFFKRDKEQVESYLKTL